VGAGAALFFVNNFLLAATLTRLPAGTALAFTDFAAVSLVVLSARRFGSVTLIYGTYGALGILGHLGVDAGRYVLHLPAILGAALVYDGAVFLGRYRWPGLILGLLPFAALVSLTQPTFPSMPRFASILVSAYAGLGLSAVLRWGWTWRKRLLLTGLAGALLVAASACSVLTPERNLSELVLRDSTYLVPETLAPYTGDVFKYFPDQEGKVQLRGHIREGLWNGEITVYHPNGRIRYLGELADGVKCGVWTENMDPDPPESLYRELKQEIESMGLYPPCPEK